MHKTNRGAEWRRRRNHYRKEMSAMLCVIILILIISYKLLLVQLLGATGLFVRPLKWRGAEGMGAHGSRAVLLAGGEPTPARGALPEHDHRASGENTRREQRRSASSLLSEQLILRESSNSARGHLSQNLNSLAQN